MSKELEALEELRKYESVPRFIEYIDIIETALNRLEELEKEWEMEHTLRIRLENINYEQAQVLKIVKKELSLEVKEDKGLYRLITYQSDNHLLRKDQYDLLKEYLK